MASLQKASPGQVAAVFYSDDTYWHERLLLWPFRDSKWMIYTPDGDRYLEDLSGTDSEGPNRVKLKGEDFQWWSRVGGPAYRFSHHPTDDQLKILIRDSYRDLLKEEGFSAEWRPDHIMTSLGALEPTKDFLGGILTSRRIMRKGGGIEDPNNEEDLRAKQSAFLAGFVPIEKPVEGKEWTAMEDIPPHSRGEVLSVDPATDVMNGELGFVNVGGRWTFARMLDQAAREKLSRPSDNKPPIQLAQSSEPEKLVEQSESDARTLYVDFDDQGIRYKEWRRAVQESRDYSYQDWPHEGPTTVLHLLKHMQKFGGDSRQWLQLWARQRGVYDSDRVMHELRCLTDVIYFGATYDQLNLPVLASMEVIARRVQSIVEAYASGPPGNPDWSNSKLFTGYQGPDDLVSPSLRSWAARKGKEEVEISQARARMRELKKTAANTSTVDEAALAVAEGSLPPGAGPKRRPRGRGKGLEAPADQ